MSTSSFYKRRRELWEKFIVVFYQFGTIINTVGIKNNGDSKYWYSNAKKLSLHFKEIIEHEFFLKNVLDVCIRKKQLFNLHDKCWALCQNKYVYIIVHYLY